MKNGDFAADEVEEVDGEATSAEAEEGAGAEATIDHKSILVSALGLNLGGFTGRDSTKSTPESGQEPTKEIKDTTPTGKSHAKRGYHQLLVRTKTKVLLQSRVNPVRCTVRLLGIIREDITIKVKVAMTIHQGRCSFSIRASEELRRHVERDVCFKSYIPSLFITSFLRLFSVAHTLRFQA